MEYDCGFKKGNNWFRYRTGGILIHDNKMLFVKSNSMCVQIILQLCAKTFSKVTAEPLTGFIVTK